MNVIEEPVVGQVVRAQSERVEEQPRFRPVFTGMIQKLSVINPEPGWHYHWLNDYPGRVELALSGGYQHVRKGEVRLVDGVVPRDSDLGEIVSTIVGRTEDNAPLRAYLMRIRQEHYEEGQNVIQSAVDRVDAAIRKGKTSGQEDSHFYIPKGAPIKMTSRVEKSRE